MSFYNVGDLLRTFYSRKYLFIVKIEKGDIKYYYLNDPEQVFRCSEAELTAKITGKFWKY